MGKCKNYAEIFAIFICMKTRDFSNPSLSIRKMHKTDYLHQTCLNWEPSAS